MVKKALYVVLGLALAAGLLLVLKFYMDNNPMEKSLFPACGFYKLTGYKCPGCGGQRALHHLLNGHFVESFKQNPLLMIGGAYLMTVILLVFTPLSKKFPRASEAVSGLTASVITLVSIILYWILRNVFGF